MEDHAVHQVAIAVSLSIASFFYKSERQQGPRPITVERDANPPSAHAGIQRLQNPSNRAASGQLPALAALPSQRYSTLLRILSLVLVLPKVLTPLGLAALHTLSCTPLRM